MDDLFSHRPNTPAPDQGDTLPGDNRPPELSVTELSQKLKRTVEDAFSFVRVRGEISRVTVAKSGHLYTSLKDDRSNLDAICWKGTRSQLSIQPEEGMEVICTGRLTTYPGRSNYQLIIETMELAGEGALLKLLEERRKKLSAEGVFDADRKKPLPLLPQKIGVVTSPTGAVIRDILHRLNDRFPRHVLLWPVMVQGKGAAEQVAKGIDGFNALPPAHRPDLIIVARGGGSLEDLMPFNEEIVVRAAANSTIPLISAVGHETDTTLIDYAADLRAPTPTGAAEKAVPVRRDLWIGIQDCKKRMFHGLDRRLNYYKTHLGSLRRGLGDPKHLLESIAQRLDYASDRLSSGLTRGIERRQKHLSELKSALSPKFIRHGIDLKRQHLSQFDTRLTQASLRHIEQRSVRLDNLGALLNSFSFERVLERGFTLIRDENGQPITQAKTLSSDQNIDIQFHDGKRRAVVQGE